MPPVTAVLSCKALITNQFIRPGIKPTGHIHNIKSFFSQQFASQTAPVSASTDDNGFLCEIELLLPFRQ
ncbi:hypothetical protein [Paenibacillus sp. Marseille-Q9583]